MKLKLFIPLALVLVTLPPARAQSAHADPLGDNLFPPELIMQNGEAIGLTEEQRDFIMAEIHKAQDRFNEMQHKLQAEVEAAGVLLKKVRVDEAAAVAQFDKVLNQERDIKRAHLALVLAIKNKLTAEQQAKLQELKKQQSDGGRERARAQLPPAIPQKMEKVKTGVQKWQDEGRDPSQVGELMQGFEPLMKEGRFKEAEELLNKALRILDGEKKKSEVGGQKSAGLSTSRPVSPPVLADADRLNAGLRTLPNVPANGRTSEVLAAEIESLRPAKQVWREIAWRQCLLGGLAEARAQQKPVILWAFINGSPCDERC